MARSHERAGELEKARDTFKPFLARDDIDVELRGRAADDLVRVGSKLERRRAAKTDAERVAALRAEIEEAQRDQNAELVAKLTGAVARLQVQVQESAPPDLATPGWVLLGAGVPFAAAGLAFVVVGEQRFGEVEDGIIDGFQALTASKEESLRSDGRLFRGLGWAGVGVGAAAMVTGVVLVAMDEGGEVEDGEGLGFGFVPSSNGGAVWLEGTFWCRRWAEVWRWWRGSGRAATSRCPPRGCARSMNQCVCQPLACGGATCGSDGCSQSGCGTCDDTCTEGTCNVWDQATWDVHQWGP